MVKSKKKEASTTSSFWRFKQRKGKWLCSDHTKYLPNSAAKWTITALATKSYLYNAGFSQYSLFSRMNPVLSRLNVAVLNIINFLVVKRKKIPTKCKEVLYMIINQRSFSYDSESRYWEIQLMLTLKVRTMCLCHKHFSF